MNTFLSSDHHIGHARISELANRPYTDVDEMNRDLIRRWNAVVNHDDTVIYLGDFAMGKIADNLPIALHLNGEKWLVPGNHDRVFSGESQNRRDEWFAKYEAVGFHILPEVIDLTCLFGRPTIACHFPYSGDSGDHEDRYADKRPPDEGKWLLHGHTHQPERVNGRMIHVGVDAHDFYPVSVDWIRAVMQEFPDGAHDA